MCALSTHSLCMTTNNEAMGEGVAVLIPCYNESATIIDVVNDFVRALPLSHIYVYDNNSTDNSLELVRNYIAKNPNSNVHVKEEKQQGKGNVIRSMFSDIEAQVYLMVDADRTYFASDALKLIELIQRSECDMAVGDRLSSSYFDENKRHMHGFGNRLIRFMVNFHFNKERKLNYIHDIMTGYRAFSRRFVTEFPCQSAGFEVETEMTVFALKNGLKVSCTPIAYKDRPEGSVSKLNTYRDGMKILSLIFMFILGVRRV